MGLGIVLAFLVSTGMIFEFGKSDAPVDGLVPTPTLSLAEQNVLLSKLVVEYDDVRKISFYYDKTSNRNYDTNDVMLYISQRDGGAPQFHLKIHYTSDDWLFIKRYYFVTDGKTSQLVPGKVERDNGSGAIWEWSDAGVDSNVLEIINDIISSKEAKIRYDGTQYYDDRVITNREKTALKNVLIALPALAN